MNDPGNPTAAAIEADEQASNALRASPYYQIVRPLTPGEQALAARTRKANR